MIGPGLARDPLKCVEAVGRVVTVNMVLTLGAIASAAILIDGGISALHDLSPAPQNRSAQGSLRIGEPALRAVGHVLALRQGDAVRRTGQDYRKARPAALRQKDKGVQPDTIAHCHHRLKASGTVDRVHHGPHLTPRITVYRQVAGSNPARGAGSAADLLIRDPALPFRS